MVDEDELTLREIAVVLYAPEEIFCRPEFHGEDFKPEYIACDPGIARLFLKHRKRYGNPDAGTYRPIHKPMRKECRNSTGAELLEAQDLEFRDLLRIELGLQLTHEESVLYRNTKIRHTYTPHIENKPYISIDEEDTEGRITATYATDKELNYFIAEFHGPASRIRTVPDINGSIWCPTTEISKRCEKKESAGIEKVLNKYLIDLLPGDPYF